MNKLIYTSLGTGYWCFCPGCHWVPGLHQWSPICDRWNNIQSSQFYYGLLQLQTPDVRPVLCHKRSCKCSYYSMKACKLNWIHQNKMISVSTCCSCRKTWNNNVETLTALDTRFAWSASGNVCKQFWTWSREERNSYVQHLTLAFVPFTASAAAHHEGSDSLPALIHFTSYSQHLDQASTVQQPLRWLSQMKETQVEDWKAIMCMLLRDCWQCLRALVLLCSLNSSKQDLLSPREIHLTASAVVHHPMTLAISSHHCNPFPKFLVISPHQNAPVTISFHQLVCWPGPHVPCLGTALSC